MPSWGTNTASPGGLYGYWTAAYLAVALGYNSARYQLAALASDWTEELFLRNIGFTLKDQDVIYRSGRGVDSDHSQR